MKNSTLRLPPKPEAGYRFVGNDPVLRTFYENNCGNEALLASSLEIFERSVSQKRLAYHPYMTDKTVERRRAASRMARAKRQNLPKALLTMSQLAAAAGF
jgi:hypothetical protein